MKTPPRKKNQRLSMMGRPVVGKHPRQAFKSFDDEQFVLTTKAELKKTAAQGKSWMHPRAVAELAVWNPPKVRCSKCGWEGTLVDCGRTYFPPDNIGWDCGNPERCCDHRLVPGVDYQPTNQNQEA